MNAQQLGGWLSQVNADGALSDRAFKVAFALMQLADTAGFVRSAAATKISDVGEPIGDTLGRLVARGHLESVADGSKIKGFRLAVRAAKPAARRPKGASVIPFPSSRRRAFVERQATMMAQMSADGAEAYLRSQLAIQGDTMRRKRIDEAAIAHVLRELQAAIRAELFRKVLLNNPREPA